MLTLESPTWICILRKSTHLFLFERLLFCLTYVICQYLLLDVSLYLITIGAVDILNLPTSFYLLLLYENALIQICLLMGTVLWFFHKQACCLPYPLMVSVICMMNQSFNLEKNNTMALMRTLNALIRIYLLTGTKSCGFFIHEHVYHIIR